ncbi:hypothetical protein H3C66_00270 [Patescibacteria group bacterium]|nr:hypothetical protein [Patescibacteria group bacterium]
MKKLLVALLTSAVFFLVATKSAEAIGCTPVIFEAAEGSSLLRPVNGQILPAGSATNPYVAYPITPQEASGANALRSPGIHWCWRNTQGTGLGSGACQSNALSSTYLNDVRIYTDSTGQQYIAAPFTPYSGSTADIQWEVAPWAGDGWGERLCVQEGTAIIRTGEVGQFSCNNPGTSASYTNQNVHVGVSVSDRNMDRSRSYIAMIKGQGAFDLGGGWAIPLQYDAAQNQYEGGSTYGANFGDGTYTVVISDASNLGCRTITDNFDIRNCAVFPQCISSLQVDRTDPDNQVDYEDRDQVLDDASERQGLAPNDSITPFSLCRQIPVMAQPDIEAQVAQIQDPQAAAAMRADLMRRAQSQRSEKAKCCLCTYGTNAVDPATGACQGEIGTPGQTNPSLYYFRRNFKPGIYTAVGCIGADSESIITRLVRIGLGIAGGLALLMILAGAFMFSTSQGEPKRASEAKELITSAVLGLIFIIFSVTLLQFIGVTILQLPGFGQTPQAQESTGN